MFKLDEDSRLAAWADFRKHLDNSTDPLQDVIDFWSNCPLKSNRNVLDPFYVGSWPTPWEIIVENQYDDFTKSVMIGYTILLTERYKNSSVQIRTLVDKVNNRLYNTVYIDEFFVLNFHDDRAIISENIPDFCRLENLVELTRPR